MVRGEPGPVLKAAVLGFPVAHSLSPVLHNAGYAACALTQWRYDAHPVHAGGLADFVAGCDDTWRGLSLTMPLKEEAFVVASSVSDLARRARAVNTLVRRADGGWDATNTDVAGIVEALRPHLTGEAPEWGTILGAGATARSAALALAELGVRNVSVRARRPEAAEGLARWVADELGLGWAAGPMEAVPAEEALVVSTVPPQAGETAAAALGQSDDGVVLDVVYANWPTPLARSAAAHGWTVVSGLDMLVHQAATQFELFTGQPAPVETMFAAGRAELGRRDHAR